MKKLILPCIVALVLSACKKEPPVPPVPPQKPVIDIGEVFIYSPECPDFLSFWNNPSITPRTTTFYLASTLSRRSDKSIGLAKIFQGPNGRFIEETVEFSNKIVKRKALYYGGCSGEFECFFEFKTSTLDAIVNTINMRAISNQRMFFGYSISNPELFDRTFYRPQLFGYAFIDESPGGSYTVY